MSYRAQLKNSLTVTLCASALLLTACGGGGGSSPASSSVGTGGGSGSGAGGGGGTATVNPLILSDSAKASAFFDRSSFGPTQNQISNASSQSAAQILAVEFAKPASYMTPSLVARRAAGEDLFGRQHTMEYWKSAIEGDDQLRQRMVFALSQIIVVSDKDINETLSMADYIDTLSEHAFGNYRDLLQDITYSPAMGRYLTYLRNRKGNESSGRVPDENYARELLQLFTIGLVELNMDGTPKLDGSGQAIEIYDNDDISGLARVFTGLSLKGDAFWSSDDDGEYSPMIAFDDQHSELEKTFLGSTITAGTPADASITQGLDIIFEHPNLAPFVSRQLIQRFTASHPTPAYVERVATAFETGLFRSSDGVVFGSGSRGDLEATLAAILLDQQFFDDVEPGVTQGKLREPVLKFIHWARAFNVDVVNAGNVGRLRWNTEYSTQLGQAPFRSNSVFNFYRPGYVAPGTETGAQNLTAPELKIVNEGAVTGYNNFMFDFILNDTWEVDDSVDSFVPDYSQEIALAETPELLADHLNGLLLSGRMNDQTRTRMIEAISNLPIDVDDPEPGRMLRAQVAIYMAVVSPEYAVSF